MESTEVLGLNDPVIGKKQGFPLLLGSYSLTFYLFGITVFFRTYHFSTLILYFVHTASLALYTLPLLQFYRMMGCQHKNIMFE